MRAVSFNPASQGGTLGQKGIRSSFNVLFFSIIRFALQFASLVILARMLSPSDYGLMGMIATATGFAALFRDMGLGVATIQKPELEHSDVNDAFWVNMYASVALVGILILTTSAIGSFYGEPRLSLALPVVSFSFLASGLSVQHNAILRRQMRFFHVGLIETLAALAALLISLLMAILGAGYWALVANPLVSEGVTCALCWHFCRWRPTRPTRLTTGGRLLHVGSHMLGINVLSYLTFNMDRVVIGRFLGKISLGLYTRAFSIVALPTMQLVTPISSVMLPMFSRLRDHPEQYRKVILSSLRLMVAVTAPAVALLVVCPDWVVGLLLGGKWLEASAVLPILALGCATQFLPNNLGLILIVAGRFRQTLIWNAVLLIAVAVGIGLGLKFGLVGVAAGYVGMVSIMRVPVLFAMVGAASPASARSLWSVSLPFWGMATVAGGLVRLWRVWVSDIGPLAGMAGASLIAGTVYTGMLVLTPAGRDLFRDLRRVLKELKPGKRVVAVGVQPEAG
jgi:PST family polysaccharide transporter